jgi:putative heme-binding domain-containing protein
MIFPSPAISAPVILAHACVLLMGWHAAQSLAVAPQDEQRSAPEVAANERVAEFMKRFPPRGVMSDGSEPTSPDLAAQQFRMAEGMKIELVASEPDISQPLFLSWDSRGRMWVVQYRQYQFPAGLKIVQYDQHLRAVFDKIPEPPPHGTSGDDVITVFEDTNGDGRYDTQADVISGLNIATSVQVGHGGIWVLNPPYLLFYPDPDGDGFPNGEPEVHLSGFGLQDTHSVANSLLWGPDGWLYGVNGSTTTGTISSQVTRGVSFEGQCVWRYHPDSKVFEIYAEGGGNNFALEIDSGGRVFVGYNGGGTRGFYQPQGSYSSKNWGKHGPLTNPYAFGYFGAMKFKGDERRFPQAFTIYEGGLFPSQYAGNIIAANAMHNLVWHSRLFADGSTFQTEDEPNLCESSDRWFRPVYAGVGPDGAVYIADWYDTRLSHVSPIDDWHKESGRVYRIVPESATANYALGDLTRRSADELIDLFGHENKWVRQRAVLELGWRRDASCLPRLDRLVDELNSLEALLAINNLDRLDAQRARRWVASPSADIRRWTVRALGDRHTGVAEFADLARGEENIEVRSQLAASAKRMSAELALPIIGGLVVHAQDVDDPHLPLMIWWALEAQVEAWPEVRSWLRDPSLWQQPLFQQHLAGKLAQRYAASGAADDLQRCDELITLAPDDLSRERLLEGFLRAFEGRTLPPLPDNLAAVLQAYQASLGESGLVLALQSNAAGAVEAALAALRDASKPLGLRIELAKALGNAKATDAQKTLLQLACSNPEPVLQRVCLISLRNFEDPAIGGQLVGAFGSTLSAEHELRDTASRTLATRAAWARALLHEINQWRVKPQDIPTDVVQQLRSYADEEIATETRRAFGDPVALTGEKSAERIKLWKQVVKEKRGEPGRGQAVFAQKCGVCHKLFGEGNTIGPPLDPYDRSNLDFWMIAMVEPSAEIREGYQSYAALTTDNRIVTGMIHAQDGLAVTIRGADNQLTTIPRDELDELRALETSLMPVGVIDDLSDQQIQDLFAYLTLGAR